MNGDAVRERRVRGFNSAMALAVTLPVLVAVLAGSLVVDVAWRDVVNRTAADQTVELRATAARATTRFVNGIARDLRIAAAGVEPAALLSASDAVGALEREAPSVPGDAMRRWYRDDLGADYRARTGTQLDWERLVPEGAAAVVQHAVITKSHPAVVRPWRTAADRLLQTTRELQTVPMYKNVYISDARGRVVAATTAAPALGQQLESLPLRQTALAQNVTSALESTTARPVTFSRMEMSVALAGTPSFFVSRSVVDKNKVVGVMTVEVPHQALDDLLNGPAGSRFAGLGETGETFLLSSDLAFLTTSRILLDDPSLFKSRARSVGLSSQQIDTAVRLRTTASIVPSGLAGARPTVAGRRINGEEVDFSGAPVRFSAERVEAFGQDWIVVAKIERAEIDSNIRRADEALGWFGAVAVAAAVIAAVPLRGLVLRPVRRAAASVARRHGGGAPDHDPVRWLVNSAATAIAHAEHAAERSDAAKRLILARSVGSVSRSVEVALEQPGRQEPMSEHRSDVAVIVVVFCSCDRWTTDPDWTAFTEEFVGLATAHDAEVASFDGQRALVHLGLFDARPDPLARARALAERIDFLVRRYLADRHLAAVGLGFGAASAVFVIGDRAVAVIGGAAVAAGLAAAQGRFDALQHPSEPGT